MCLYFDSAAGKPILCAQIIIPVTSPLYVMYINFSGNENYFVSSLSCFIRRFPDAPLSHRYQ
jgi:hypothetical protein